jgi:hypothetical protein
VIAHLVLLTPRPELTAEQRAAAIDVLARAASDIPEIVRFKIGRRIRHGLPGYEQLPQPLFEVVLMLELQDVDALKRYLSAPAHMALGHLFATATAEAAAYDYQIVDAKDARSLWD